MNKTIAIIGNTGSGKSTIAKELYKHGYNAILQYTTRPIRANEINGVDSNFITDNEFIKMIQDNKFAEYKYFDTIYGRWYYGSLKEDYKPNGVIVMNPGALQILKENNVDVISVYIKISNDVILNRLAKRGDDVNEVERRLNIDTPIFEAIESSIDIVTNGEKTVEEITADILSKLERG